MTAGMKLCAAPLLGSFPAGPQKTAGSFSISGGGPDFQAVVWWLKLSTWSGPVPMGETGS